MEHGTENGEDMNGQTTRPASKGNSIYHLIIIVSLSFRELSDTKFKLHFLQEKPFKGA